MECNSSKQVYKATLELRTMLTWEFICNLNLILFCFQWELLERSCPGRRRIQSVRSSLWAPIPSEEVHGGGDRGGGEEVEDLRRIPRSWHQVFRFCGSASLGTRRTGCIIEFKNLILSIMFCSGAKLTFKIYTYHICLFYEKVIIIS